MGHSEGSPEREVYGDTGLPKKDRNISNKQPNLIYTTFHPKKQNIHSFQMHVEHFQR